MLTGRVTSSGAGGQRIRAGWRVKFRRVEMPEETGNGCREGLRWSRVAVSDRAWRVRPLVIQPSEGLPRALQNFTSFWKSCFRIVSLFPDSSVS